MRIQNMESAELSLRAVSNQTVQHTKSHANVSNSFPVIPDNARQRRQQFHHFEKTFDARITRRMLSTDSRTLEFSFVAIFSTTEDESKD